MNAMELAPAALAIFMALVLHWLPSWRRENQYFGATTPAGFDRTAEGRRALLRFRIVTWTGTAAAILMTRWPALSPAGPLVQVASAMAAFAFEHRRIARFAIEPGPRTASLQPDRETLPGGIVGAMMPLAILAAAAIYVSGHWDLLPERIPVHWDIAGNPNRWVDRTVRGVAGPLLVGAITWAVLLAGAIGILKASRKPSGENAEWTRRFRRANLRMLVATMYAIAFVFASVVARPALAAQGLAIPVWVTALAPLAAILPFAIPIVRLSNQPGSGSDSTPDACWYWGQIYYNRNDPALLVERRFGLGYTFNFGNRLAWLFLVLPLAMVAATRWM